MDRRRAIAILACLGAAGTARAQQRIYRIGFLHPGTSAIATRQLGNLRTGLREHGYVEGRNLTLETRIAENRVERLPALAAELVRMKVDVIVTSSTPGTRAAKQATATLPIVMAVAGDPVGTGLVADLARPGGNVTGGTFFDPELAAKRVELLRECLPKMRRLGVLINPGNPQAMGSTRHAIDAAARAAGVSTVLANATAAEGLEAAFAALRESHVEAVKVVDDPLFLSNMPLVARLARGAGLPSAGGSAYAEAGGLLGYGVDFDAFFRRAAYFVDRILKGARPAEMPVERATEFQFFVNQGTAKALGLTLPPAVLLRADRVFNGTI